ncbi:MAG: type II secretion system protein [Kiritimatiellae bacterium]|nr:type II secretion system protein [Kiritimatiellia bacterium]
MTWRRKRKTGTAGFTLLEVMLAVIILGGTLSVLYRSIIVNIRMIDVSHERQEIAYVFSLGELEYPLRDIEDIEEDAVVDPDSSLKEGYVFERTVDEKEDPEEGVVDDGLYVVRTTVTWGDGRNTEEIVRYMRKVQ